MEGPEAQKPVLIPSWVSRSVLVRALSPWTWPGPRLPSWKEVLQVRGPMLGGPEGDAETRSAPAWRCRDVAGDEARRAEVSDAVGFDVG